MKQLITAGVDVNARDGSQKSNTALHFASTYANADMIHCLCGEKDDVCFQLCITLVSCVLSDHGADVTICNGDGITPLQDAMKRGDATIIMALVEHSNKQQTSQPMNR